MNNLTEYDSDKSNDNEKSLKNVSEGLDTLADDAEILYLKLTSLLIKKDE